MPRNYHINDNTGGTNMAGRAYTPQVTPWDRDSDDVSVQRSLREDSQEWRDRRDERYDRDYRSRDPYDRGQDVYYREDLVPAYGEERAGYRSANSEREDRHRAGHRKNWENRDPDYRYQYNDYRRADDSDVRRENQSRYSEHRRDQGYRRDDARDYYYSQGDYDRDRYNERERYYARDADQGDYRRDPDREDRGRWNRR